MTIKRNSRTTGSSRPFEASTTSAPSRGISKELRHPATSTITSSNKSPMIEPPVDSSTMPQLPIATPPSQSNSKKPPTPVSPISTPSMISYRSNRPILSSTLTWRPSRPISIPSKLPARAADPISSSRVHPT